MRRQVWGTKCPAERPEHALSPIRISNVIGARDGWLADFSCSCFLWVPPQFASCLPFVGCLLCPAVLEPPDSPVEALSFLQGSIACWCLVGSMPQRSMRWWEGKASTCGGCHTRSLLATGILYPSWRGSLSRPSQHGDLCKGFYHL